MMYRCESCGHLFEEGEQAVWEERHGLDTPPYEKWDGCPVCRGSYDEARLCKECDEWYTKGELYDGWCEKCLRETINYDTFFEYCEANKNEQYLDIFVMSELLGGMDCPDNVSCEFHTLMIETYKRKAALARLFSEKIDGFLEHCVRFVMEDEGDIGIERYAKWWNERRVK